MNMPQPLLDVIQEVPLEREHEGWVTWQIKEYFESVGQRSYVWALGRQLENIWNVDELVGWNGKLFGLQMKRAELDDGNGRLGFHQVCWDLQEERQFDGIKECENAAFYCLPTFVNRDWRKTSLHHSLFWHPTSGRTFHRILWYERPNENDWWCNIERNQDTYRWGGLIERLQHCQFGWKVENGKLSDDDAAKVRKLSDALSSTKKRTTKKSKKKTSQPKRTRRGEGDVFYLVGLEIT